MREAEAAEEQEEHSEVKEEDGEFTQYAQHREEDESQLQNPWFRSPRLSGHEHSIPEPFNCVSNGAGTIELTMRDNTDDSSRPENSGNKRLSKDDRTVAFGPGKTSLREPDAGRRRAGAMERWRKWRASRPKSDSGSARRKTEAGRQSTKPHPTHPDHSKELFHHTSERITTASIFSSHTSAVRQKELNAEHHRTDKLDEFISRDLSQLSTAFANDPSADELEAKNRSAAEFVLLDDSAFRISWDLLSMLLIVFYVFVVPLRMSFDTTATSSPFVMASGGWYYFDLSADMLFLVDIALNFRTVYRKTGGEIVTDPHAIRMNYLHGWFVLDVLASLPLSIVFLIMDGLPSDDDSSSSSSSSTTSANKILRFAKFAKLSKLFRVLKMGRIVKRLGAFGVNPGYLRLLQLVVKLFALWHFVACAYWLISVNHGFCNWNSAGLHSFVDGDDSDEQDAGNDDQDADFYRFGDTNEAAPDAFQECVSHWMPWDGLIYEELGVQYSQAFFWAVMVMSGIGYDIAPVTPVETWFTIAVIMVGIIMNAAIIGAIASAIATIDASAIRRSEHLDEVTRYLAQKGIPAKLRFEIQDYYSYRYDCEMGDDQIVADLPPMLQMKLEIAIKKKPLERIEIFSECDPLALLTIVHAMTHIIALPSELLTRENSVGRAMFIVQQGRLSVSMHSTVSVVYKRRMREHDADSINTPRLSIGDVWRSNFMDFQNREDILVGSLQKGDYFGERSLLQLTEDFASRCDTYCELSTISAAPFKQLLREFPELSAQLHESAATRLKELQARLREYEDEERRILKEELLAEGHTDPDERFDNASVNGRRTSVVGSGPASKASLKYYSLEEKEIAARMMQSCWRRKRNGLLRRHTKDEQAHLSSQKALAESSDDESDAGANEANTTGVRVSTASTVVADEESKSNGESNARSLDGGDSSDGDGGVFSSGAGASGSASQAGSGVQAVVPTCGPLSAPSARDRPQQQDSDPTLPGGSGVELRGISDALTNLTSQQSAMDRRIAALENGMHRTHTLLERLCSLPSLTGAADTTTKASPEVTPVATSPTSSSPAPAPATVDQPPPSSTPPQDRPSSVRKCEEALL